MMRTHDYEGVLRLGLRHMTMVRINAVPYAQFAAEIASDCPAEIKRKYPCALPRLAYELYLSGMTGEFDSLMNEIEGMMCFLTKLPAADVFLPFTSKFRHVA